ncbi:MAG TPA: LuxR C-terminal-related transcriptional regulator [Nocardioidaceae bacterium]|nr:LuxR C-terminal-related transcriptional regulator [Nocardioidaceae bacterium]
MAAARFGVPEPARTHVRRRRLLELLRRAETLPLVVVSAPAGTGKSALVAEWAAERARAGSATGWITFEDEENVFWSRLLECLGRLGIAVSAVSRGAPADVVLGRARLTTLARLVAEATQPLTVVVDGYEMVSAEQAREVDYLLRRTFGRLRLVLVGRVDPVLPLYRYRLNETVAEIRADDLAFSHEEASQLLAKLGVVLGDQDLHDLNERTRGWATGLRFAVRALAGRPDAGAALDSVLAQMGDINEYLLGEVLDRQTPAVRQFLLDTSVPDVLCPALVEQIGGERALHTLAELVRSKAFVETVPDQPGWVRYYPFFRDLLRAQLNYESPGRAHELHRRVAAWYARERLVDQAISHLAAASAWDELGTLIVDGLRVGRLLLQGPDGTLAELARRIPSEHGQRSACLVRAALAIADSDPSKCASELVRARENSAADAARDDAVTASAATVEAVHACLSEPARFAAMVTAESGRLLDELSFEDSADAMEDLRGLVQLSSGVALLRAGDARTARRMLSQVARSATADSHLAFKADCLAYLALCDAWEGHLSQATRAAAEAAAAARGVLLGRASPAARVALARVALDQCELATAGRHLATVSDSRGLRDDPASRGLVATVRAGIDADAGRLDAALAGLENAAATLDPADPWLADSLRIEAARLCNAAGEAARALELLSRTERAGQVDTAVTMAAVLVEQGEHVTAAEVLGGAHQRQHSLRTEVSMFLVEAGRESLRGASGPAVALVNHALRLAAGELLRRPFCEAGPAVRRLLAAAPTLAREHRWLDPDAPPTARPLLPSQRPPVEETRPDPAAPVVEQLTPKELEVLGHLAELLTTEEIAEKMFVSVNTVRTHVRSILRKLGVNRRYAAVRKARMLGILDG